VSGNSNILDTVSSFFRKENIKRLPHHQKIEAIKGMNLSIREGERIGVIGRNGAGKSSLLKLVAGIYPPTRGDLFVDGRVTCLFQLSTGFEMYATGWENIYLRGLMLGATPKEMKKKAKEIADFSELGSYLDIPVRHYSSGMFMRLAFSVSTAIDPDILLLDEVIAAGDAAFLAKAAKRMRELVDRVRVLIFVSHGMDSIKKFCDRVIWLEKGVICADGSPNEVISEYLSNVS
jgi:lipopolysaccharide transport system ATP-binding protein